MAHGVTGPSVLRRGGRCKDLLRQGVGSALRMGGVTLAVRFSLGDSHAQEGTTTPGVKDKGLTGDARGGAPTVLIPAGPATSGRSVRGLHIDLVLLASLSPTAEDRKKRPRLGFTCTAGLAQLLGAEPRIVSKQEHNGL